MEEINVQKSRLLQVLKENRDHHREEFEKALDGWKVTVLEEVEKLYAEAKAGRVKQAFLNLPRPEDHTKDYERYIQMLEMDIDPNVHLDESEFRMYVQDDFGWRQQWTSSNSAYIAKSSSR